jgi:photosystem II stability/assembly factor-like uncharacterized protein
MSRVFCIIFLIIQCGVLYSGPTISGKITTTNSVPVNQAKISFVNVADTSRYFSSLSDSLGNYNITITSVENRGQEVTGFQLYQNYPNPFSERTTIAYQIKQQAPVVVSIYNILGQRVKTFQRNFNGQSIGQVQWDGRDAFGKNVANGIYFYSVTTGNKRQVKKMLYVDNMTVGETATQTFRKNTNYYVENMYLDSSNIYTVYIENTDSTKPKIESAKIDNVVIAGDTTLDFQVNEAPKWEYLGLDKETIESIAINPNNLDIIYAGSQMNFSAGTQGKLFKTTNGGTNWDTLMIGGSYRRIVIDPLHPETVYVAPWGILKTTNGGQSWQDASSGLQIDGQVRVQSLEIDPKNTNILYAGTGGYGSGTVYKTVSSGAYWWDLDTSYNNGLFPGVFSLAVDPNNTDIIYAGTDGQGRILKSIDGGNCWSVTGLGATGSLIDMIAIDPKKSSTIYSGVRFFGLWISKDSGTNWDSLHSNLTNSKFSTRSLFFNPLNYEEMFVTNARQAYFSTNNGLTWELLSYDYENNEKGIIDINPNGRCIYGGKLESGLHRFNRR